MGAAENANSICTPALRAVIAANALVVAAFCTTVFFAVQEDAFGWPALASVTLTIPSTLAIAQPRAAKTLNVKQFSAYLTAPILGVGAYLFSTFDVYVVAWAATPWIFVPLYILNEADLVLYPVATGMFLVQRMSFYATARAYSVGLQRLLGLPTFTSRVAMLVMGTVETTFMAIGGARGSRLWYDFPVKSAAFVTYALVKSVWLLCSPLLEEKVLEWIG